MYIVHYGVRRLCCNVVSCSADKDKLKFFINFNSCNFCGNNLCKEKMQIFEYCEMVHPCDVQGRTENEANGCCHGYLLPVTNTQRTEWRRVVGDEKHENTITVSTSPDKLTSPFQSQHSQLTLKMHSVEATLALQTMCHHRLHDHLLYWFNAHYWKIWRLLKMPHVVQLINSIK